MLVNTELLEDRIYLIHFASLHLAYSPGKKKKKERETTQLRRERGRKEKKRQREREFKGERGLIVSKCLDVGYHSQKKSIWNIPRFINSSAV